MRQGTRDLTITLTPTEANAVVETILSIISGQADGLEQMPRDTPGDIYRIAAKARRISDHTAVGDSLRWMKHWGFTEGMTPDPVTAPEATWLDLLKELQDHAEDMRTAEVNPRDRYAFDAAARSVARTFADAEVAEGDR